MPKGKNKGTSFEREMCKLLGLWWSNGKTDDIFWRAANSGGRATVRSSRGQSTFGQYGDIQATDPAGQPLIDLCTIELKRGYNRCTFADIIDRPESVNAQEWEKWVEQAEREQTEAGSKGWLLITRRDRREALVFMPLSLYRTLCDAGASLNRAKPLVHIKTTLKHGLRVCLVGSTLSQFTRRVSRDNVIAAGD